LILVLRLHIEDVCGILLLTYCPLYWR